MISIFTMPNATTTMDSLGLWSSAIFNNFLPIAYIIIGFIVGGLLLRFVIDTVINAVSRLTGKE